MSTHAMTTRVFFFGNPYKDGVEPILEDLVKFASPRCKVVGCEMGFDGPAAIKAKADRIVVLGGDGTLIGVARSLGLDQVPLVGVNFGKLGFLAEFTLDELKHSFEAALCEDKLVCHRTALQVTVTRNGDVRHAGLAINDCVIQAGPPFRMISLDVAINNEHLTSVRGDGLIVCTPSGSTAHNLSAGGPILQPGVDAIVLTPLNPHSLTHKPLVIEREFVIDILASEVNEGSTAIIDGQVSCALAPGDRTTVRRSPADYLLVRNPRYARWHKLVTKLYWGQSVKLD